MGSIIAALLTSPAEKGRLIDEYATANSSNDGVEAVCFRVKDNARRPPSGGQGCCSVHCWTV